MFIAEKKPKNIASKELIPVLNDLIGDRKLSDVERAAGIAKGSMSRYMSGDRFPGPLILQRLSAKSANPQNNVTYEDLLEAAGYMPDIADTKKHADIKAINAVIRTCIDHEDSLDQTISFVKKQFPNVTPRYIRVTFERLS